MMNGQQQQQPGTYDANLKITVTLTFGLLQWQQMLNWLVDAPAAWRVANPLILEIQRQVESVLQRTPSLESQQPTTGPRE